MVSNLTIAFMAVSLLIAVLMPVILVIYFYKKHKISLKVLFIGVSVFVVFQLLTRIPLLALISTQGWYKSMAANIAVLAIFLGLTAGLFEEVGRYIAMKLFMKNNLRWKDGLAFGIGHGGIESIIIVGLSLINYIVLSFMINAGLFDSMVAAKLPPEAAAQIKSMLIAAPAFNQLAGGFERIMAMILQIAFSMIVLYSIKAKKPVFLLYAILLHCLVDSPLVILSYMKMNVWAMELILAIIAAAGLALIIKFKDIFAAMDQKSEVV